MLNMLIAMMNSTYSLVSSTRATTWRIESLRTALWFERKMPLLKNSLFLRFKTYRRVVDDRPHWYIDYIPEQVTSLRSSYYSSKGKELELNGQISILQMTTVMLR